MFFNTWCGHFEWKAFTDHAPGILLFMCCGLSLTKFCPYLTKGSSSYGSFSFKTTEFKMP